MNIEIIDDNTTLARSIQKGLEKKGYHIALYDSQESFFRESKLEADIFMIDIHLGDTSGLDILKYLRTEKKLTTPIIIISGQEEKHSYIDDYGISRYYYLEKPFSMEELLEVIQEV